MTSHSITACKKVSNVITSVERERERFGKEMVTAQHVFDFDSNFNFLNKRTGTFKSKIYTETTFSSHRSIIFL